MARHMTAILSWSGMLLLWALLGLAAWGVLRRR